MIDDLSKENSKETPSNLQLKEEKFFRYASYFFEISKIMLTILLITFFVNMFVLGIFRISGESMEPNFFDGELVLVDKLSYANKIPSRGDVIILEFPADPENRKFIKRVIGLPGEIIEIKDGSIFINNELLQEEYLDDNVNIEPTIQALTLKSDEVYVVGDNRLDSYDSRFFGPLPVNHIVGKATTRLKFGLFRVVSSPTY